MLLISHRHQRRSLAVINENPTPLACNEATVDVRHGGGVDQAAAGAR